MKHKILFVVLVMLVLMVTSIASVSALKVKNKYEECNSIDNITEINVHCFYDENRNRVQDENERDANNFYVFATDFIELSPGLNDKVGQTDYKGDITFELDTTNGYIIKARETYFNTVYGWSGIDIEPYFSDDSLDLPLPCQRPRGKPKTMNIFHSRLNNILEQFGLSGILVNSLK